MEISVILLCLILCAFFSGMEIAFISSNKIYLEIEKKQDSFISKILTKLTEKPSKFIVAMLIGNTIALVIYGFFMGELLMRWVDALGYHFSGVLNLIIQTSLSAFIVLITAEFLPKVFFSNLCQFFIEIFCASGVFFLQTILLCLYFFYLDFRFCTKKIFQNSGRSDTIVFQ